VSNGRGNIVRTPISGSQIGKWSISTSDLQTTMQMVWFGNGIRLIAIRDGRSSFTSEGTRLAPIWVVGRKERLRMKWVRKARGLSNGTNSRLADG
jgi:hypothetical protein